MLCAVNVGETAAIAVEVTDGVELGGLLSMGGWSKESNLNEADDEELAVDLPEDRLQSKGELGVLGGVSRIDVLPSLSTVKEFLKISSSLNMIQVSLTYHDVDVQWRNLKLSQ